MKKFPHYVLIATILVLTSCNNLLEKEVDEYPLPFEEELVVTAFLMPQDSLIEVDVRTTYPVNADIMELQQQGITSIPDAEISISDGVTSIQIPYNSISRKYQIQQSDFPLETDKMYHIHVSTPDGLSANATCTIPVLNIEKDSIKGSLDVIEDGGLQEYYFQVSFPNDINTLSYYAILKRAFRYNSNDHRFLSGQEQLELIKSSDIIGNYITSKTFSINPSFAVGGDETEVLVCKTDSSYYNYHHDLNNYAINSQNPFTEEFNIYTNIENGKGAFAGLNCIVLRL